MDTSEKYIKMCSLAKEIQRKWMFQSGDFVYNPVFDEVVVLLYPGNNSINYIWLPRQDQLQEICIEFFMKNLEISKFEANLRFLEWYSWRLRYAFEHGLGRRTLVKSRYDKDLREKMGWRELGNSA